MEESFLILESSFSLAFSEFESINEVEFLWCCFLIEYWGLEEEEL